MGEVGGGVGMGRWRGSAVWAEMLRWCRSRWLRVFGRVVADVRVEVGVVWELAPETARALHNSSKRFLPTLGPMEG